MKGGDAAITGRVGVGGTFLTTELQRQNPAAGLTRWELIEVFGGCSPVWP
ncbi:hypothetical protein [Desulfotruncus arcticus]|nr:hypothetical protein [Desulfotruncus arcticus]